MSTLCAHRVAALIKTQASPQGLRREVKYCLPPSSSSLPIVLPFPACASAVSVSSVRKVVVLSAHSKGVSLLLFQFSVQLLTPQKVPS